MFLPVCVCVCESVYVSQWVTYTPRGKRTVIPLQNKICLSVYLFFCIKSTQTNDIKILLFFSLLFSIKHIILAQNKAACPLAVRQSTERMNASLSWLRVEERLACNLMSFFRNICYSKQPNFLYSNKLCERSTWSHFVLL